MSIVTTMGATLAEVYGPDVEFGDMARAALRAIKPEDVSDGMLRAFEMAGEAQDEDDTYIESVRRAIAAAIAAGAEQ